jgi:hypothetical protein
VIAILSPPEVRGNCQLESETSRFFQTISANSLRL